MALPSHTQPPNLEDNPGSVPPPGFQKEPPQRGNDLGHQAADLLGFCESTPWLSLNALSALVCRSSSLSLGIPCHREDYSAHVITKRFWVC